MIVPLSAAFMYFLAVFSFGLAGDLAARQSIYPARMFTLPVTTARAGGLADALRHGGHGEPVAGHGAFRRAGRRDSTLPLIWPALLAAAFLAWTQVLTWMPYGLPGLRVIVTVLWLAAIDAVVILAVQLEVPEPRDGRHPGAAASRSRISPPASPWRARAAATCPIGGECSPGLGRIADVLPRRRDRFPSPARAQAWFEWRQQGRSLPALVGILLPFELALLFLARDEPAVLVFGTLLGVLLTPPFMAGFAAVTVGRPSHGGSDSSGVTLHGDAAADAAPRSSPPSCRRRSGARSSRGCWSSSPSRSRSPCRAPGRWWSMGSSRSSKSSGRRARS